MKIASIKLFIIIFFFLCTPANAVSIAFKSKMEKCGDKYCVMLNINSEKKKFLVDTGSAGHIFFYDSDESSNGYLEKIYKNGFVNKYGVHYSKKPIKIQIGDKYSENFIDVRLLKTPDNLEYLAKMGVSGIMVPQLFDVTYVILDFKNNYFIGLNGSVSQIRAYLRKNYQSKFIDINDYKRGKVDHFYLKARVNNRKKSKFFALDTGGLNLVWNGYAKSKSSTNLGAVEFMDGKTESIFKDNNLVYKIGEL